MNNSLKIGSRSAMAFLVLGSTLLFGACTAGTGDTVETEDETLVEEENVESTEQAVVSGWTPYTSEEYPPIVCDSGSLMSSFQCTGGYCDNIRAYCQPAGGILGSTYWTPYFSEEAPNNQTCANDHWVTSIDCNGSNCDNVSLQCTRIPNLKPINCYWTGWVSEEGGGYLSFGSGYYMRGAQCSGSRCDNMSFLVCQAAPVVGCTASTCGGYAAADGCWCDASCVNYGDCCYNACNVCGSC